MVMLINVLETNFFLSWPISRFAKLFRRVSRDTYQSQLQMSVDGENSSYKAFDATDHQVRFMIDLCDFY